MLRSLFLGNPELAVPFLELLHEKTRVAAVITSPDQPAGRGYSLQASPVKLAAQKLNLPFLQLANLKDPAVAPGIRRFEADLGVVVAYGKILPKDVLPIPRHGFLNVHFSLLPKYRGAAPIQWTLANGESETGVTLFWLDEGMDTGPVFIQKRIAIAAEDDADSLRNKLVELGVLCLAEAITQIEKGEVQRVPQGDSASKAPILKKADGFIDWNKPAGAILNQMRGFSPWPGTQAGGLKILKAKVVSDPAPAEPGTVVRLVSEEGPVVKCGQDSLVLLSVQPEGKKPMNAWSWWQGARLKVGEKLR